MKVIADQKICNCRICGALLGEPEVILNNMPLTDGFVEVDDLSSSEFIKDILIYECKKCGFVQNPVNFSYADYYKDYNLWHTQEKLLHMINRGGCARGIRL